MTARVFVDTNVLVYQFDTREPDKQGRARAWLDHLWTARAGRVSFQVLQEFYVIVTRKLNPGLDRELARGVVRALWTWRPALIDEHLFTVSWTLQDRFGLSWWDSLIVAAAKSAECSHLLTEDLQHGQDLEGLRVINPFEVSPEQWQRVLAG
ncbi:MAG TPA: PIN domain-containing protein [Thermoanaerobaculia bacterium]|jgi:predicted nucleic acid-binding protein|nr:PIN domain-containing protein [Thermoanaerobaculia bacterium]